MAIWGYDKGGRFYKRKTGTKRYPDSGIIKSNGKKVGRERVMSHVYGQDRGKIKKKYSKKYRTHPIRRHGRVVGHRGGYRRKLR